METTKKRVKIYLEDGRVFSVSGHVIAHDRAEHHAARDKLTTYEAEYQYAVDDDFVMRDWLMGNMDWYELVPRREEPTRPLPELNKAKITEIEMMVDP